MIFVFSFDWGWKLPEQGHFSLHKRPEVLTRTRTRTQTEVLTYKHTKIIRNCGVCGIRLNFWCECERGWKMQMAESRSLVPRALPSGGEWRRRPSPHRRGWAQLLAFWRCIFRGANFPPPLPVLPSVRFWTGSVYLLLLLSNLFGCSSGAGTFFSNLINI